MPARTDLKLVRDPNPTPRPSSLETAETVAAPIDSLSIDPAPGESDAGRTSGSRLRDAAHGLVRLVEGSSPRLSVETRDVLQRRLFLAAGLFCVGFAAFFVRCLLYWEETYGSGLANDAIFYTHLSMMVLTGGLAAWMRYGKAIETPILTLVEWTVFGGAAFFFTVLTQHRLAYAANMADGAHLPVIVPPWLLLIFIYALFIPNTWRRALRFLTPAALVPIGVIAYQYSTCVGFRACVARKEYGEYLTEQGLEMLFALLIGVVGVHTINTLRKQAFEAKQLGQYRLKHKLGSGGMGEVYLAEHQLLKRPCAVKLIRPDKAGDPRNLARFEREVRSTAKLSHWNTIDIFDYGRTDDGTFYYVMEFLPGHNTGELVDMAGGPLPAERVVYLMDQVCRALAEAHGIGLIHRDIKPANIFCAYRGGEYDVAKLLDFGLAKPTDTASSDSNHVALTQEGAITGSPLFMSPEQATGESEVDARSDIYSLGCVLYYLLTGQPPYPYQQAVKVIIAHASENVLSPRAHNPDLSEELEQTILRCLEKDPEDRFQTVQDLREALLDTPLAEAWTEERAADWWNCNACPQRKAMAEAAIEAAAG